MTTVAKRTVSWRIPTIGSSSTMSPTESGSEVSEEPGTGPPGLSCLRDV